MLWSDPFKGSSFMVNEADGPGPFQRAHPKIMCGHDYGSKVKEVQSQGHGAELSPILIQQNSPPFPGWTWLGVSDVTMVFSLS